MFCNILPNWSPRKEQKNDNVIESFLRKWEGVEWHLDDKNSHVNSEGYECL